MDNNESDAMDAMNQKEDQRCLHRVFSLRPLRLNLIVRNG